MSEEEPQSQTGKLVGQLGTDPIDLSAGRIDVRRLGVGKQEMLAFDIYGDLRGYKSRFWRRLMAAKDNRGIGVEGRGRRDLIRGEAVMKGAPSELESEIKKPNIIARNVYDRDWEKKEKERLGVE